MALPVDEHVHIEHLLTCDAFAVTAFHCPGVPEMTEAEAAPHPEIVMPRLGSYIRHDANGAVYLDRSVLGFFEAGQPYTIRHLAPRPDVTTVISLTAPDLHGTGQRTFARSAIKLSPDIAVRHRRLLKLIAQGGDEMLAAEECATNLILSVRSNLDRAEDLTRVKHGAEEETAVNIAEFLNRNFQKRVVLSQIGAELNLSIFQICRVFQSVMKSTIHDRLTSLRLERATAELLDTTRTVTDIALGLGYSSHAHFTAQFTKKFGFSPRTLRARHA